MEGLIVVVAVAAWIGFGVLGGKIWEGKGGSFGAGFAIALFGGIIGLIVVMVANPGVQAIAPARGPRAMRECPFCKELMRRDASVCPHCRNESEPWIYKDGYWWARREDGDHYLDERTRTWIRHEGVDI